MMFLGETRLPAAPRLIADKPVLTLKDMMAARAERRDAWNELWSATDEVQSLTQNSNARARAMQEAYGKRNAQIFLATGIDPSELSREEKRKRLREAKGGFVEEWANDAYKTRLKELEAQFPEHKGVIRADVPIEDDAAEIARASEQRMAAAKARAGTSGLGTGTRFGASLGGGFRAMMRDPVQVGTLVLGAGPSAARTVFGKIVSTMLTEAVVNGGVEAIVQAASHEWKKRAGLDASLGTALAQIGMAAAFGGGFGGLLEGGRAAIGALKAPVPDDVLRKAVDGDVAAVVSVAEALGKPIDETTVRTLERAATDLDLDRAAFGADVADDDGARSLADAVIKAVEDDAPLPVLQKPAPPAPRKKGMTVEELAVQRAETRETLRQIEAGEVTVPVYGARAKKARPPQTEATKQTARLMRELAPAPERVNQPLSLHQFVAANGGVADYDGELRNAGLDKLFVPRMGKLVRENGKTLDYAREAAAEAGYFDHLYGTPEEAVARSTVDDLVSALDEDVRRNRIYSSFDAEWLDERARADDINAWRDDMRTKIRDVLALVSGTTLPDSIIKRAVELSDELDSADEALERAIIEDYNRDVPDIALERDDGSDFEIPFFADSDRMPEPRGQIAQGSGSQAGPADGAVEARGAVRDAGASEGTGDGLITADTLRPLDPVEPGTKPAADLAALAVIEARRAAKPEIEKAGTVVSEKTDAGMQVLIPGVGEITIKDRLDAMAAKPLRGGNKAAGGLFDETVTNQMDIADFLPAGTDAEGKPRFVSHADMIADAERNDFFGDLISSCKD